MRTPVTRTALAAIALAAGAAPGRAEPQPEAEAIRRVRDAVLDRSEFRYGREGGEGVLARILRFIREIGERLMSEHPVMFWIVVAGLCVVLVLLVWHMVWSLQRARRRPTVTDDLADLDAAMRRLDAAPFRASAVAHAAGGRFDEAVRELYTALLLVLDRRGALRYGPHKSLLDYRIEAARDEAAHTALDAFEAAYPPGSFGRRPPAPRSFAALLATVDSLAAGGR